MLKALLKTILILSLSGIYSVSFAEMSEEQKECSAAIDTAFAKVAQMRDSQNTAAANDVGTASADGKQQGSGNPIADIINKIAEGNQKKAELINQQMEQERQINTEQFKQTEAIRDKLREIEKEKSRLPIEIRNATFERKKQEADIRMKCQARAQTEYDALVAKNSALSQGSRYEVGSLSQVRGTRNRMRSQRKLFYARCINDPSTQEALQLAVDELDTKLYNFTIQSGIHNADLEYTQSKIPRLLAHMDENRRYVAQAADVQMQALDQQMQMQQMGAMFAVFTSAANSSNQQQAVATFNSADDVLNKSSTTYTACANDGTRPVEVPSDMMWIFEPVNRVCRPTSQQSPENACVRSSGQPSTKPVRNTVTS